MVLALTVRIYYHNHIFMSDEANNLLTIKALIEGEGLRSYFFKHPPLFTILSSAINYPFGDNHHVVQGVSLAFSVLSMIPFSLIVEKVFDKRTALVSLLFLSVLPMSILYSTWVKQDAMLLFFFLWSLYLYIMGKPLKSGIVFGIASLTKEFAWFLIPIIAGWELLSGCYRLESAKRFLIWLFAGIAISGWWYAAFGRESFEAIDAAAYGGNLFEFSWHYPWYYYIRNLRADLTLVFTPLFVLGLASSVLSRGSRFLPVLWLISFYLPLTLMTVKAPWYTYLASPAMALIVAVGFLRAWDFLRTNLARWGMVAIVAALTLYNLYIFDGTNYYRWLVARDIPEIRADEYLYTGRGLLRGGARVAVLEYNPTLQYYLGIADRRLYYLGSQFPAMGKERIRELAEKHDIGWFVLNKDSLNFADQSVAHLRSLCGEPKEVGNALIFNVFKENTP